MTCAFKLLGTITIVHAGTQAFTHIQNSKVMSRLLASAVRHQPILHFVRLL